jgi:hypothetical protein
MRGTRGLATSSATLAASPENRNVMEDDDDDTATSGLAGTESTLKRQVKTTLADVAVPPQLLNVMNMVSMKMATAATSSASVDAAKEDRKEEIDGHDCDDREVGDDDDELLASPRHKKPRRDIFAEEKHEADKKADEENAELRDKALMDTASITDDEESRHSYISTLPPEVPSFSL